MATQVQLVERAYHDHVGVGGRVAIWKVLVKGTVADANKGITAWAKRDGKSPGTAKKERSEAKKVIEGKAWLLHAVTAVEACPNKGYASASLVTQLIGRCKANAVKANAKAVLEAHKEMMKGKSQRTFNKGAGSSKGQSIAPGVTYSGDKYIIEASNPATAFVRSLAVLRDYYDALDERDQKMIRSIEGWVEEFESTDAE